jgi:xylulokinase
MPVMGIDIGTYESKGAIVADDGTVLAEARRPHELRLPRPGWAEHDPEADWWGAVAELSRVLRARTDAAPEALAVSAIGPCCLPVDAAGAPLRAGILYGVDTRASDEIAALNARLGEDAILRLAGTSLTSQQVGPKILWLRREAEVWARMARLHTATSFVLERLTGAFAMDRYTAASWAPLYDIARGDWAEDLHGICDRAQLPRLSWSAEIAGRVTAAAAAATGLPEGLPVTTGTIDAAAEAVSAGVARPGDMMLMYGSTVFVIELSQGRVTDPRLWAAPWLWPGPWAVMAGLSTSGTLTQWWRGIALPDLPRDEAFDLLAAEALASPPGAKGLICLPYFSGERTPIHDPSARGMLFGLNLTHGRGDIARALYEGIAFATRHVTETFAEAGAPPARVVAVGGGTRSEAWLQATSDVTGLTQALPRQGLGAAYGDCWLALRALGRAPAPEAWNPPARLVEPRDLPAYAAAYPIFRALYERTRDLMGRLP